VDSFDGVQCCGGQVVSGDGVCCGDDVTGQSYASDVSKVCCGQHYVDRLTTHCCTDHRTGHTQVLTTSYAFSVALPLEASHPPVILGFSYEDRNEPNFNKIDIASRQKFPDSFLGMIL